MPRTVKPSALSIPCDALICETSSTGTLAIEVSGYDGALGGYTLSLEAGACTSTNAPIAPGDSVAGDLSPNDCYSTVWGFEGYTFMDRYTYDQDRVSACCHHVLDTQGRLESFCEYNARHRVLDSWQSLPQLAGKPELAEIARDA